MATPPPPLVPRPELVAVLVPGDGRFRFCSATLVLEDGDWVAVSGPFGPEPGRVVSSAGSVFGASDADPGCTVLRLLDAGEVTEASSRAERALRAIEEAARLAAAVAPTLEVVGLRFTLSGEAICSCLVPDDSPVAGFVEQLARFMQVTTRLERVAGVSCGSLGKRAGRPPSDEGRDLSERLERLGALPHLGSHVRGAGVEGVLQGIAVRHLEARVRDATGEEQVVPVEQLEP